RRALVIAIHFKAHCQPDKIDQATAAFAAVVEPSRNLDGVISFDIARDLIDPNTIIAIELFANDAARQRQEALPEVAHVMNTLPDLLAAPPQATIYEITSATDASAAPTSH